MAASLAERLKLKQYQVDTWTNREQLCLVSAVMRSGDQNCWVAVRRNIKMLTNETSRPADWYSTKNCALQYAKLLERVDTPKRKRERGDGGNETPGEIVTKMLTKQRVEELQVQENEERASYTRLRQEVQQLEAGLLDHKLDALWDQLIKEQAEEEEEEQRHQQWLKEREEKITAIQQALKHQGPKVTMPPHKKKQKSHIGGIGCAAGSRRNSGLSETSSEVDSTVDSPDLNEATPESLVSNKSQDEGGGGGGGESEVRPTPASPLLTTLLSKSPLAPAPPPPILSTLSQRGVRGLAFVPVSEALQNLVTSAISGTDSTDKDKTSHTTSPSSGSLTLSRLLDLPPSTPGQPLPRLSDLPGPTFHHREQEKESEPVKKPTTESDSCGDNKGCGDGDAAKDCASRDGEKTPESSVTDVEVDDAEGVLEDERKDSLLRGGKEGAKEEEDLKKPESLDQEILDLKETSTPVGSEAEQEMQTTEGKCEDEESKSKEPLEEASLKKVSRKSEGEETTDKKSEDDEGKTKEEVKTEDADIFEDVDFLKTVVEKEVKEEVPSTSEVEKEDGDGEREGAQAEEGEVESKKGKEDCSKVEDVKEEVEGKVIDEPQVENKEDNEKEKNSLEEDLFSKIPKIEDLGTGSDLEKKVKKTYQRREPEEDLDKEDSKGWVSEEESSSTSSSRKRKLSGGDLLLGCSSPLISESAPNSPASTHCGDDSESEKAYRSWKKPIMILWNEIAAHKFASLFLRPITDEKAPGYHLVVYRAMDLQKIKRNIESGLIRTTAEFQRDIMLMFLNATMYNTRDHNVYHMAYQMMKDAVSTIEDFLNTQMLARAEDTPQKSLRRETRESSAKRTDDDPKRKREPLDEKSLSLKKRRL